LLKEGVRNKRVVIKDALHPKMFFYKMIRIKQIEFCLFITGKTVGGVGRFMLFNSAFKVMSRDF
jgi:hypothetical protein